MTRSRASSGVAPALSGLRKTLDALAAKQTTATELAEQALEDVEACKRSFNAFSVIDWDRALKAAA
jgi:aspartyl-tRNA(Asn)/glutamyl-tRNA(Gln) amidotransferase subunit A